MERIYASARSPDIAHHSSFVMEAMKKRISGKARRPKQSRQRLELPDSERKALAARVKYIGSPEHKESGWWDGLPKSKQLPGGRTGRPGKQTTTICPLISEEDRRKATDWVRSAIAAGQYRFFQSDKDFPKKIWYQADGKIWFGLVVNPAAGEYKGWPISEKERREIFD